jgi:hypothetical protein
MAQLAACERDISEGCLPHRLAVRRQYLDCMKRQETLHPAPRGLKEHNVSARRRWAIVRCQILHVALVQLGVPRGSCVMS